MAPIPVSVQPNIDNAALARIEQALRTLPKIELDANATPAQIKIQELRARLEALRDKVVRLDVNDAQAKMEMALVKAELDKLDTASATMDVRVDAAAASAALSRVDREADRVNGKVPRIRVEADVGQALSALASLTMALSGVDGQSATVHARADVAGAIAGLAMVAAKAFALGGAVGGVAALGGAVAALGPIGAIAAGGLGAAVVASLGVGKALGAMSAQQDSAATDAQASAQKQAAAAQQVENAQFQVTRASQAASQARSDAAKNVARAEQDAARQVASAQQSAARSIASAEKQAVAAHRSLRQATADLAREQRSLTSAWEAGRRSLQDLQDQVDGNALDQRQAALDLADARDQLAEARASGDPREIARAQLAYDKQVETIDQLNKATQRLGVDNANAQRAGVAGSSEVVAAQDRIRAAQERVSQAALAARDADAAVNQARIDGANAVALAQQQGAQRVADAREQGARAIASADQQVMDANRALAQALRQTADTGSAAANKVAQAFANLSPAAAAFARYLWSLKPAWEALKASAASGFFPPVQAGLAALMTQLPALIKIIGLFGAAMGGALGYILTQLASPFWMGFFQTLADAAGPILMQTAQVFMQLAGAVAQLLLALLPLTPAALNIMSLFAGLVTALVPFVAQLVGALIPAAAGVLQALFPLGPVLAALGPILAVLAQAFSMVLGAVLTALAPILVALTPLIQQLAMAFATSLVNALVALTPFLVGLATWMSAHPGLVIGLITALTGLFAAWTGIKILVAGILTPLGIFSILMRATGATAATLLAPFAGIAAWIGRLTGAVAASTSWWGLLRTGLAALGAILPRIITAIGFFFAKILLGTTPLGMLIRILTALFITNTQFRDSVMNLVGTIGGLVGSILSALMPAFNALGPVLTVVGNIFGGIATGLATALVPIVNALAKIIEWLTPILTPLIVGLIAIKAAVIAWSIAQWALNLALAANPIGLVVLAIAALVGGLIWAYQNVGWFRDAINAVGAAFVWLWQTVLQPVVDFLWSILGPAIKWIGDNWNWLSVVLGVMIGPIGWLILAFTTFRDQTLGVFTAVGGALSWFWTGVVQPVLNAIGAFFGWVWTYMIKPPLDLLVWFFRAILGPLFQWFCYLVVQPILNAIGAAFRWLYDTVIKPVMDAIGAAFRWLYDNVIKPVVDAIVWAWKNLLAPAIQWAWNSVIKPVLDWVGGAFRGAGDIIGTVTRGIADAWNWVCGLVRDVYEHTLKPIIDAVKGGFEAIKGAVDWITSSDPIPPPPGYAAGGLVVPVGYAAGGWVGGAPRGFAAGGGRGRPKPGATDTVPAVLTPGEFVMTRSATTAAGAKTMYGLQQLLERNPGAGRALAELVVGLQTGPASSGGAGGAGGAGAAGFFRGGLVGFAAGGAVPGFAAGGAVAVKPDAGAAGSAAASTTAMAGSMQAATAAAAALNPMLAGLATTQQGLLAPAQTAVMVGQQAMAATVTGVLAPAMATYQQQVGVAAPLANTALQAAQLGTQLSTTLTAQNTALNSQWMAASTTGMSLQSQFQLAMLRQGQLNTQLSTNLTAQNNALNNQGMLLSTTNMSLQSQFQHSMLRQGQLFTQQHTIATAQNAASNNQWMMDTTGQMSAVNQNHLANLRGGQAVTSQATTAFADAFRAQMGRTMPDSGNPIRWVINFPIASLIGAWNHLDGQFALGKQVPPFRPNFARGGVMPGYTPGYDNQYAHVSGGEAIMRPEWTRVMGADYVREANAAARRGGRSGVAEFLNHAQTSSPRAESHAKQRLMRRFPLDNGAGQVVGSFAYGGVAPHVAAAGDEITRVFGAMPGGIGGKAPRGNVSDHPSGFALDFMTLGNTALGDRVFGHLNANRGRMQVKYLIWKQHIDGRPMENRGSPTANHFDHVHASFRGGPGGDGGGGGFFDPTPIVDAAFAKAFREVADIPRFFGPSLQVGRDQGTARFAADRSRAKALEKVMAAVGSMGMDVSGISGPVVEQVRQVAHRFGWGAGPNWDNGIFPLVAKESSWNPGAANPSSSARGLFQKMTSIHGPIEPTPAGQAVWGLNYIKGRYGDPVRAWAYHRGHNFYDQGGLALGKGLMLKQTDYAERVLSPIETRNYEYLGQLIGRGGMKVEGANDGTGDGQRPIEIKVYPRAHHNEEDVAREAKRLMDFEVRS